MLSFDSSSPEGGSELSLEEVEAELEIDLREEIKASTTRTCPEEL